MPLEIARYLVSTLRADPQLKTLMGVTPHDPRVYPYYHAGAQIDPAAGKRGYVTYANTANNERLSAVGGSVWSLAIWSDTDVTGVAMRDRILALLDLAGERERVIHANGDVYQPVKVSEHWSTQENTKFFGIQMTLRFGYSYVTPLVVPSTGVGGSDAVAVADQVEMELRMAYRALILADGASYYWRLGETSGTTAVAAVGGAHGTITGGVALNQPGALTDGTPAMTFDGVTGQILTSSVTLPTLPYTVECWLAFTSVAASQIVLTTQLSGAFPRFSINTLGANGELVIVHSQTAVAAERLIAITTASLNDGAWHHLVAIILPGTAGAEIFVDGVSAAFTYYQPVPNLTLMPLSKPLFFGNHAFSQPYSGALDEVALYPRALTPAEIAAHYAMR